jgi:hypothetical protein
VAPIGWWLTGWALALGLLLAGAVMLDVPALRQHVGRAVWVGGAALVLVLVLLAATGTAVLGGVPQGASSDLR